MKDHKADSHFIGHEPCPKCGSKDNLARYSDGHGYCYGCEYWERGGISGHWNKGDTVWNEHPKNTAPIGWVCTASGTPGNWSAWGFIGNNT